MDAHFDSQIQTRGQRNQVQSFRGPARQFGSGGIGAFAMRMGRVAIPLVKKYVVPVAKEFGKNLLSTFVPELSNVISGRKRPRAVLKETFKKSASKTFNSCATRAPVKGIPKNKSGGKSNPSSSSDAAPRRAPTDSRGRRAGAHTAIRRPDVSTPSQPGKRKSVISKKKLVKRSRSDILSGVSFTHS